MAKKPKRLWILYEKSSNKAVKELVALYWVKVNEYRATHIKLYAIRKEKKELINKIRALEREIK